MNVNAKVIHEFAIELKKVVEEFEEEMEILSNNENRWGSDELQTSNFQENFSSIEEAG